MDKNIVYIIGHKNPDTDSVCSTIAYAEFKRRHGTNCLPVKLGGINKETEFALKYFDVRVPETLYTVRTQISDLDIEVISPADPNASIKTAWSIMRKNNYKVLPVVDKNDKLMGIVTLSDITKKYMDIAENNIIENARTPLSNIIETLNATLVCGGPEDFETSGRVVILAMSADEIGPFVAKGDIAITGDRKDSQLKAIELGVNCLIVTCGVEIAPEVIERAKAGHCIIMSTLCDTFTAATLINQSIPISYVMTTEDIVCFNIEEFVDDIKTKMTKTRFRSYPVVDAANRIKGFISRYHLIEPHRKRVILLDHNERSQTVEGIEQAELLEVIDHHRLGDIQTANPIYVRNEPVGSTSTIVANMFFENGMQLSKKTAGSLCAGILSDTLYFKSPTTTYLDRINAEKLAEISNIDISSFAMEMLRVGSSLRERTPEQLLFQDFKDFSLYGHRVGIGQVNTIDFDSIEPVKKPLFEYMENMSRRNEYNLILLMFTDFINTNSMLMYTGKDKEVIPATFNVKPKDNCILLKDVVSRKMQIVPALSAAFLELAGSGK